MVGMSGLEPPTSSLSEMRSNRLSYTPMFDCMQHYINLWCQWADLNHRHKDFQSSALPLSYTGIVFNCVY